MEMNNVETSIKYWNFNLSSMDDYTDSEDPEKRMLHFLSLLNDKEDNKIGNNRIIELMQELKPAIEDDYSELHTENLESKKKIIIDVIQEELQNLDFSQISLMGISAKYYQWIPGLILAEEIKKVNSDVKIVVGGFGSVDAAQEAMDLCPYFDFVTWGEGEYPLLSLYQQIDEDNPDFENVPRLIYRENKSVVQSKQLKSEYLDFSNYSFPNFDDYMDAYPFSDDEDDEINFPINTIRSCNWRRCKFCDFNSGYKLRSRTPENIVAEIEYIIEEYGITTFSFVDSDTFGNLIHFEELLDLIIDLKFKSEEDLIFWAEIIPNPQIDTAIMKKMAIAGFKNLFIGYDGLSDKHLKMMDKRNTFADNIFFVKESIKYSISPIVNVIRFIPRETKDDILNCIDNLKFLRFFYNNPVVKFEHIYVDLVLSSTSKYYKTLTEVEKKSYDCDDITYLMPKRFSEGNNRFRLFRYKEKIPVNADAWSQLAIAEEHYKENTYSYTLLENDGVYYYTEFCNDTEIENIIFGEQDYGIVLKLLQKKIYTLQDLLYDIQKIFPEFTVIRLKEILSNLKKSYLVYCDDDYHSVVGLVEVG